MSKEAFPELIKVLSFSASGFTQLQAAAYIALLKMGEETGSAVASESGINRSKIYDILNQLEEMGAVNKVSREGKTKYVAVDPNTVLQNILDDFRSKIEKSQERLETLQDLKENIDPEFTTLTTIKLKDIKINDYNYIVSSHEKGRLRFQDKLTRDTQMSKDIMILDLHHSTEERGLILIGNTEVVYLFGTPVGDTAEALKIENTQIAYFIMGIIRQDWIKDIPLAIREDIQEGRLNAIYIGKALNMVYAYGNDERKYERPVTFLIDEESIQFIYFDEIDLKIPYRFFNLVEVEGEYGIRVKMEMANGTTGDLRMTIVENPLYLKNLITTMSQKEREIAELKKRLR